MSLLSESFTQTMMDIDVISAYDSQMLFAQADLEVQLTETGKQQRGQSSQKHLRSDFPGQDMIQSWEID